jgi:sialate O-acetylesterase
MGKKIWILSTIFCFLLIIQSAFGQVKLPRLISDGMVLQRDTENKIWGWAESGEKVEIKFIEKSYATIANDKGVWEIVLSSLQAGGPYNMEVNASNQIIIKDILVGDVWVCSGQSNMVLPIKRVRDLYEVEIAASENSNIRHFFVPMRYDFNTPQEDLKSGSWESANPENVLNFSATAYFFAKDLYKKYHVPIGLINASVGGTPIEAWMSEEALKEFPIHYETMVKFRDSTYVNQIIRQDKITSDTWYDQLKQLDKGIADSGKPWYDPTYDASSWKTMEVPSYWDKEGLGPINGVVWFRKEVDIPAPMVGKPAKLTLGSIVDADYTYVNGKLVGSTSYKYPPRKYTIPENLLKKGKNVIVVRIISTIGRGGFVKDKKYQLSVGNHTIDLKGEWQYQLGAVMDPLPGQTFIQYKPVGLFNGMIAPLLNYKIKGVIWYQGESNTGRSKEYGGLFSALIDDWRQKWNQGIFPFLYVQLPNHMEVKDQPSESGWAELREAQLKTLTIPNTGMAVTIDIGEWNDIHPLNKQDVGKRLALAAQKVAYGDENVVFSGPIYQSQKIEGNKIILTFINIGSGLVAKGGNDLKCFAIAGADKKFVWATAKINGNKVVVWSDQVTNPVAVRYAWADNPEGANLYNKEGLPASPFRTDEL